MLFEVIKAHGIKTLLPSSAAKQCDILDALIDFWEGKICSIATHNFRHFYQCQREGRGV